MASCLTPANELLHQGGASFAYQDGRWQPTRVIPGLLAAGAAAGTFGLEAQLQEGRQRGAEAAAAVGHGSAPGASPPPLLSPRQRPSPMPNPQAPTKCFICLYEDVTPE